MWFYQMERIYWNENSRSKIKNGGSGQAGRGQEEEYQKKGQKHFLKMWPTLEKHLVIWCWCAHQAGQPDMHRAFAHWSHLGQTSKITHRPLSPIRHHHDRWSEGERQLPLNDVGCLSYLTVGWVTATMWKAFRVIIIWTMIKLMTMMMKKIAMIMMPGGFDPNGRVRDRRSWGRRHQCRSAGEALAGQLHLHCHLFQIFFIIIIIIITPAGWDQRE